MAETNSRDEAGRFLPGNRFWEARSKAGPNPKFETPEALLAACLEYFEWVEDNPLITIELVKYQGKAEKVEVPKMRAMTIGALCLFLDISYQTWRAWTEDRPDLSEVISRVEEYIKAQKFEGAAAEMFNPNIIARDLGLAEKKDVGVTNPDGSLQTIDPNKLTIEQRKALLAAVIVDESDADES